MTVERDTGQVLQVEVVLGSEDYHKFDTEIGAIATTLTEVAPGIVPVVTDPVYKHGLAQSGELEGVARVFEQRLIRLSPLELGRSIIAARSAYADEMNLYKDALTEEESAPEAISDWVLTITTRRSFIDALGALDTVGVKERIERMRNLSGWMICILDASDGVFVTRKGTTETADLLLEGQFGDKLDTKMNPAPHESPDIPLFDNPHVLKAFLESEGLVDTAENEASNSDADTLKQAFDMAELYELFMSPDQPDNASLQDFEQWIYKTGTVQSFHKEYLLSVNADMEVAAAAPNDYEREKIVQLIRASLTDALLQGLPPHIVRECARVINTYILK